MNISNSINTIRTYCNNAKQMVFGVPPINLATSTTFIPTHTNLFKKKNGFGKRLIFCKSTLDPVYPLPEEFNILRSSGPNDYVCLEGDGLLSATLKLQISDRKNLGVKTKGRQFTVLFKVETKQFKEVLNVGLRRGFTSRINGTEEFKTTNVRQIFTGSFNNVPLKVSIKDEEFGAGLEPNSANYSKIIVYKFYQAYRAQITGQNVASNAPPRQREVNVVINEQNLVESRGLYIFKDDFAPFERTIAPRVKSTVQTGSDETLSRGREKPIDIVPGAATPQTPFNATNFNAFSKLPFVAEIIAINPVLSEGRGTAEGDAARRNVFDRFFGWFAGTDGSPVGGDTSDAATRINLSNFIQQTANLPTFLELPELNRYTLVIEDRLTVYDIVNAKDVGPEIKTPLTFAYYEDGESFERVFANTDFLGACLHQVLYQHVEKLHGPRVIYNSIKFDSYQQKRWTDDLYCRKGALQKFSTKECQFNLIHVGKNPLDVVNYRTNLLFTAEFSKQTNNFYKTNRFITCSAFMSQNEVADITYKDLFSTLEQAFVEPVVLSDYPFVSLIPCFERGTIIQVAERVYFRGLVSNASSEASP